jgi:hypothetical protein
VGVANLTFSVGCGVQLASVYCTGVATRGRAGGKRVFMDLRVGFGLHLRPSTIWNGGIGLFTSVDIPSGVLITRYDGEVIDHKEALARRGRGNDTHIRAKDFYVKIDGIKDPKQARGCGGGSFANDCTLLGVTPNSTFYCSDSAGDQRKWDGIFLESTRDILSGEELFACYGNTYWKVARDHAVGQSCSMHAYHEFSTDNEDCPCWHAPGVPSFDEQRAVYQS